MKTLAYNTFEKRELVERVAMMISYDDESECMIALDVDSYMFVVIDCEHDAQARRAFNNRALFHASYADALALLDFMKRCD